MQDDYMMPRVSQRLKKPRLPIDRLPSPRHGHNIKPPLLAPPVCGTSLKRIAISTPTSYSLKPPDLISLFKSKLIDNYHSI